VSDIESSNYSETAASNTASPPDGAPENMARSAVNDTMREMMAGTKREWNRSHPTITSAGTEPAFTLTYTTAPAAYVQGQVFTFKAHASPTGSVTANVNSLGAKKVYDKAGSAQLGSGAWAINTRVQLSYDSALDSAAGGFVWLNQGQVYTAGSGVTISSNAVAVDINGLTEDTSPDVSNDFVATYDASAAGLKKVKPVNLIPAAASQAQQETGSATTVYVTPAAGATKALVVLRGGGGGGGGAAATNGSAGGGGGQGGLVIKYMTVNATESYAIGSGGTGVSAGNGNNGGNTTFSTLTAGGGGGGVAGTSGPARGNGGTGGTATGGDLNIPGAVGAGAGDYAGASGAAFGGGQGAGEGAGRGAGSSANAAGSNATANTGGGGGGAASGSTAQTGGTGGSGYIIVYEYS